MATYEILVEGHGVAGIPPPAAEGAELPLLPRQQQHGPPAAADDQRGDAGLRSFPWLTALGFVFLSFNSGMAMYRSQGDGEAVAFVAFSYLDLVLLFVFLRTYEQQGGRNTRRIRIVRASVWVITLLLAGLLGWKVASIMPLPAAMAVWVLAGAALVGVFYAFFVHRDNE